MVIKMDVTIDAPEFFLNLNSIILKGYFKMLRVYGTNKRTVMQEACAYLYHVWPPYNYIERPKLTV